MEKEENRYYERTRMEIVKLKYKHFDGSVQLEKISLVEDYDRKLMIKTRKWSFYETKDDKKIEIRDNEEWSFYKTKESMTFKYGVVVLNASGVIDADYKDEIKVILMNLSKEDYIIKRGDAVAQMGFVKMFKGLSPP
ncbi:deoxyuridine 5'-triphosphate nucleotidohydrolase-like [Hydra vulgaris]|uniref:Deoxyuridine 5'-triphosphate nucleotidohydrolase n=1 Tax=Hydra vulgaris TaxID=6087 RepID=A0ABM4B2N3_HYDVU